MKYVSAYGVALVIFLVLDFLWLGVVAKSFYAARMGDLMLDHPRWGAAAIFYLLYLIGLVYFAISGGFAGAGWAIAARDGALFGFFTYLTYNATCLSVLKGFDPAVAVVDTLWGTAMGAIVSGATVLIVTAFRS